MTEQQEFCLRWNDFHSNFHLSLDSLRGDESFTDVTLSCSGRLIRAHRVILSACSVHFKEILRGIPAQQHPVIVLPTVDYEVMQAIMDFIYQGQVNVKRNQLGAFLQVAETFSIQGLADEDTRKNASKATGRPRAPPDTDPPSVKRRRCEPPQPGSSPAKTTAPPASSAHAAASDSQLPASVEEQEQSAEGADAEAQKTVNISVAIKSEGLADAMVGELLDPAAGGEMLDPDMESGSDVVAQAMATIDTPASGDSLRSLDSLVTTFPMAAPSPRLAAAITAGRPSRSAVHDYFSGEEQDRVCRLCGLGIRLNRQLSTSGLWSHMRHRHPQLAGTLDLRSQPHWAPPLEPPVAGEHGQQYGRFA